MGADWIHDVALICHVSLTSSRSLNPGSRSSCFAATRRLRLPFRLRYHRQRVKQTSSMSRAVEVTSTVKMALWPATRFQACEEQQARASKREEG